MLRILLRGSKISHLALLWMLIEVFTPAAAMQSESDERPAPPVRVPTHRGNRAPSTAASPDSSSHLQGTEKTPLVQPTTADAGAHNTPTRASKGNPNDDSSPTVSISVAPEEEDAAALEESERQCRICCGRWIPRYRWGANIALIVAPILSSASYIWDSEGLKFAGITVSWFAFVCKSLETLASDEQPHKGPKNKSPATTTGMPVLDKPT